MQKKTNFHLIALFLLTILVFAGLAKPLEALESTDQIWALQPMDSKLVEAIVRPPKLGFPENYTLKSAEVRRFHVLFTFSAKGFPEIILKATHKENTDKAFAKTDTLAFYLQTIGSLPANSHFLKELAKQIELNNEQVNWVRVKQKTQATSKADQEQTQKNPKLFNEQNPSTNSTDILDYNTQLTRLMYIYLGLILLYVFFRMFYNGKKSPCTKTKAWDNYDNTALTLILIALALRVVAALLLPISGDEASNLEPDFWLNCFLLKESHSSPPLFRFLIHLGAEISEHLFVIRIPAIIFGTLSIWLIYRLARQNITGLTALFITALLAFHGDHFFFSTHQKAYTLWLCLLLLAQSSFLKAIAGDSKKWQSYALWLLLAAMTHYFTIIYIFGWMLYLLIHRRDLIKKMLVAIWPAIAASIPFILPILLIHQSAIEGRGILSDPMWLIKAAIGLFITAGGLGFLLLFFGTKNEAEQNQIATTSFKYLFFAGLILPFLYSLNSSLEPRMFFPLLAFGLLWIAKGLEGFKSNSPALKAKQIGGSFLLILVGIIFIMVSLGIIKSPIGYSVYNATQIWQKLNTQEKHLFTNTNYYRIIYELSGRRMSEEDAKIPQTPFVIKHVHTTDLIYPLNPYELTHLEKLLDTYKSFDFFDFDSQQHRNYSPAFLENWLNSNCHLLLTSPPSVFKNLPDNMHEKYKAFRCSRKTCKTS